MNQEPNVGDWVGVSEEARRLYEALKTRWNALVAWGVGDKMPSARRDLEEWFRFSAAWDDGEEDEDALSEGAAALRRVEEEAAVQGYEPKPRVAAQSRLFAGALASDTKEPGADGGGLGDIWRQIPTGVMVGTGVAVGAVALSQARPIANGIRAIWRKLRGEPSDG